MDSGKELGAAKETYGDFIALVKWGAILVVVVTALVVALIASS